MAGRDSLTVAGVLVVFVLVAAGPLTGLDVTRAETTVDTGAATVESVALDPSATAVTDGRFGVQFDYLRVPTATVTVASVTGRPRLVYVASVPELSIERVETRVLTAPGRYRLTPDAEALAPETPSGVYEVSLTVRVQSFDGARTLTTEQTTVEVSS
jgi:hypothetical protein